MNQQSNSILRLAKSASRSILKVGDMMFDLRYGVRTSGYISVGNLDTQFSGSLPHAAAYESTRVWTLRDVFRGLDTLGRSQLPEVFVDLGCGTGRACFYAATKGSFRTVQGIDFSPSLIERARCNARSFRGPSVQFKCGDAATYRLPDRPCLVFMFNPFDEIILQRFLTLNAEVLTENKDLVMYANDQNREILADMKFIELYRNSSRKTSIWEAG